MQNQKNYILFRPIEKIQNVDYLFKYINNIDELICILKHYNVVRDIYSKPQKRYYENNKKMISEKAKIRYQKKNKIKNLWIKCWQKEENITVKIVIEYYNSGKIFT